MGKVFSLLVVAFATVSVLTSCGRETKPEHQSGLGSRSAFSLGSVSCSGYSERRIFLESQAWRETDYRQQVNLGTCFPYKQTVRGKLNFQVRVVLVNNPGNAYELRVMTEETILTEQAINFSCHSGTCSQWFNVEVDTAKVPFDGRREFRFSAKVKQPDGSTLYQSTGFQVYLNNGKTKKDYRPYDITIGRGFHSVLDNVNSDLESDVPLSPISGIWNPRVDLASGGTSYLVYADGSLLKEGTGRFREALSIDLSKFTPGPHELTLISKKNGNGAVLSGVLVVPFEVAGTVPPPPVPSPSPSVSPRPSVSPSPSPSPRPSATPSPSPSASPRPSATPTPEPSSSPVPLPGPVAGIWMNNAELMAKPTSGAAWDRLKSAANSSWGSPNIDDINNPHDVLVLAGALYAARTGDSAMRTKTISGLTAAVSDSISEHGDLILALSRTLQTYVIAADLIGYHSATFDAWVRKLLNYPYRGHSNGTGVYGVAVNSSNNWGNHARASTIASAIYLNDTAMLNKMTEVQKEWIGLAVSSRTLAYDGTNWHATSNKAGVNRKGSVKNGINIDGALPEEMRRGAELSANPAQTDYAWEGMQGAFVASIMLHRAGKLDIRSGDDAIKRAINYLYLTIGWPAEGDDLWQPWLASHYLGMSLSASAVTRAGKNMSYTDWTHSK